MKKLLLGKFCMFCLKNLSHAVVYDDRDLSMSPRIEGMVVDIDDNFYYLSNGTNDKIETIIPKDCIGYIEIEPKSEEEILSLLVDDSSEGEIKH